MGPKHSDLIASWRSNNTVQWEEKHENIANWIKGQHSWTPLDLFPTSPLQWLHIYSSRHQERLGRSLRSPNFIGQFIKKALHYLWRILYSQFNGYAASGCKVRFIHPSRDQILNVLFSLLPKQSIPLMTIRAKDFPPFFVRAPREQF